MEESEGVFDHNLAPRKYGGLWGSHIKFHGTSSWRNDVGEMESRKDFHRIMHILCEYW
jgi:hypothetical protein